MPKYSARAEHTQPRHKKPYGERQGGDERPQRRGPKPPPSAPVISKHHKEQQKAPQSLDLSAQELTEPPNLAKEYPRLAKLNLTDCRLTTASFVSQAKHTLTWLNLSGNKLRDESAWQGIELLETLFVLNASHCELTSVPKCVASLRSLKALVLSHNSLTALEHVRNLPDLNTIVVSNNQLTSLPSTLTSLPSLKKISAAHNLLTPPGLPNLSSLSHLHELRLSHNPNLTSLPSHFGAWGKNPLPPSSTEARPEQDRRRRGGGGERGVVNKRQGIEILDLSSCGFENWFGLRALAEQDGIVNLGLKGNKVAQDAIDAAAEGRGFEEFKSKLTILLPSLRILDSVRFDAKHFELKSLRASRTPEQALLDAGPMALELLAKKSKEEKDKIELAKVEEILKAKEREKENKRRRRKGLEELGDGTRRREREERLKRERLEEHGGEKEQEDAVIDTDQPPAKKKKSKKDKNSADTVIAADEELPPQSKSARKRENKKQKSSGGVLDALKGDPLSKDDKKQSNEEKKSLEPEKEDKKEEKQKTSVLKVIEVKKPKDKRKGKKDDAGAETDGPSRIDVGELLGLGKKQDEGASIGEDKTSSGSAFDLLGSGSGTGMFGGGGWD